MAWIMKNSAGTVIPRRSEPYLTLAIKDEIEQKIIPRYPSRRAALLPTLHRVQDEHGWLPYQALEEIADFLGLTPSQVTDTATFYEMFHLQPKGKYLIMVCQSISCELRGESRLMTAIRKKLGIEVGQTTSDNRFTLMHAECLGSCGTAPCALINDKLFEDLSPETVGQVLDSLP